MNWYELADNPHSITDLYIQVPTIEKMHLMDINLNQEDSTMSIRADLPVFPDKLPDHWKGHAYNVVQVSLKCIDMETVEISGWVGEIDVNIQLLQSEQGQCNLYMTSHDCSVRAVFHRIIILSIKGYIDASKKNG